MTFRAAHESEDALLSTILYNAFLPLWNHNWFQNLSSPLEEISTATSTWQSLSRLQRARRGFYLSLVKATRLVGGEVLVLAQGSPGTEVIEAILLWLPPKRRVTLSQAVVLYRSGLVSTMISYGAVGIYRINFVFEENIKSMFSRADVDPDQHGFVQMLAANPEYKGKGSASKLLAWQIKRHEERFPGIGTCLDTSTEAGVRAYRRLGFEEIGRLELNIGTDRTGIRRKANADQATRADGRSGTVQWVMIKRAEDSALGGMAPSQDTS